MSLIKKRKPSNIDHDQPKATLKTIIEPFLYLLPFIIGVGIFTIYPIFNVLRYSFMEGLKNPLSAKEVAIGFANYAYVLNDPYFFNGLKNTATYVIFVVPISTCLAIVVATLLNQKIKFKGLFQTAYFLPLVTSSIAIGICWKYMFSYEYGFINYLLNTIGIESIAWLTDPSKNIYALIIYGIWNILPFTIILLLSGLQNIDELYYTAAKVDGAKPLRIFFRITVPLLAPTIGLVSIINTISCFKVYSEVFPLFNGQPGVAYNLYTVVYYIYYQFRVQQPVRFGRASAAALILFLIIFGITMFQMWFQKKWNNNNK